MRLSLSPALVAATAVVATAPQAIADPVFIDGPPDTGDHSWCTSGSFSHPGTASNAATNLEDWTVVNTIHKSSCGDHTDVRWTNGGTGGAYGKAECVLWQGNGRCDRYRITINNYPINQELFPAAQRRKTYCHELGHTAGVSHYWAPNRPGSDSRDSCLRSGPAGASANWHTRYGGHHRFDHINPWFS